MAKRKTPTPKMRKQRMGIAWGMHGDIRVGPIGVMEFVYGKKFITPGVLTWNPKTKQPK